MVEKGEACWCTIPGAIAVVGGGGEGSTRREGTPRAHLQQPASVIGEGNVQSRMKLRQVGSTIGELKSSKRLS